MRQPFWWQRRGVVALSLWPLTLLWRGGAALRNLLKQPRDVSVPVIAIGNVTAGGGGKTPTTQWIAEWCRRHHITVHIISRGYGGTQPAEPHRVDPATDRASYTGDEPLLLAQTTPVWVCRDRHKAAQAAIAAGATLILLDDGAQQRQLATDATILVFDGGFGIGNAMLMPAGPLREDWQSAVSRADLLAVIGTADTAFLATLQTNSAAPLALAQFIGLQPVPTGPLLAFSGIARPEKFFNYLREQGAELVDSVAFADHHPYQIEEIELLLERAEASDAQLISTAKDWIRIPQCYQSQVIRLDGELRWQGGNPLEAWLLRTCNALEVTVNHE